MRVQISFSNMAVRYYTLKVTVYEGDVTHEAEPISEREISELASVFTCEQMEKVTDLLQHESTTVTGRRDFTSIFDLLKSWRESNKSSAARQVTHSTTIYAFYNSISSSLH